MSRALAAEPAPTRRPWLIRFWPAALILVALLWFVMRTMCVGC